MTTEKTVYEGVKAGELEIDGEGRIWRVASRCGAGKGKSVLVTVARKRAEFRHKRGYLFIARKSLGVKTQALAHRLVWQHFQGDIPDGLTINHKDGVKDNNRPDNLELATHGEQALHALHVIQTRVPTAGELSWTAKLTEADVQAIRARVAKGERQKDLAAEHGVDPSSISNAVHGVTWAVAGVPEFVPTHRKPLSDAQMADIRRRLQAGAKGLHLAREYGVSTACISRLRNGQTWQGVTAAAAAPDAAAAAPAA